MNNNNNRRRRQEEWGEVDDDDNNNNNVQQNDEEVVQVISQVPVHFEGVLPVQEKKPIKPKQKRLALGRRTQSSRRAFVTNDDDDSSNEEQEPQQQLPPQYDEINNNNTNMLHNEGVGAGEISMSMGISDIAEPSISYSRTDRQRKAFSTAAAVNRFKRKMKKAQKKTKNADILRQSGSQSARSLNNLASPNNNTPTMMAQRMLEKQQKQRERRLRDNERNKKRKARASVIRNETIVVTDIDAKPTDEMLSVLTKVLKHGEDILWCERRSTARELFLKKFVAIVCGVILIFCIVVISVEPGSFSGIVFGIGIIACLILCIRTWDNIQKLKATFYAITTKHCFIGHVRYCGLCDTPLAGIDHRMRHTDIHEEHMYMIRNDAFSKPGEKVVYYEEGQHGYTEIIPRGFDGVSDARVNAVYNLLRKLCGFENESDHKNSREKKRRKKKKKSRKAQRTTTTTTTNDDSIPQTQF